MRSRTSRCTPRCSGSPSMCQSRLISEFQSALLSELVAHEQQLLAGMGVHQRVVGAQVGEALPAVARHPADQRRPSPDRHRIVRQRQDVVLLKGCGRALAAVRRGNTCGAPGCGRGSATCRAPRWCSSGSRSPGRRRRSGARRAATPSSPAATVNTPGQARVDLLVEPPQQLDRFEVLVAAERGSAVHSPRPGRNRGRASSSRPGTRSPSRWYLSSQNRALAIR